MILVLLTTPAGKENIRPHTLRKKSFVFWVVTRRKVTTQKTEDFSTTAGSLGSHIKKAQSHAMSIVFRDVTHTFAVSAELLPPSSGQKIGHVHRDVKFPRNYSTSRPIRQTSP